MVNWKYSTYRHALLVLVALAAVACSLPSGAIAGGLYFGVGVDVPLPGPGGPPPPPVDLYAPPPVVVERRAPERVIVEEARPHRVIVEREPVHRVVVEQPPPRVIVEPAPPRVVYEAPAVVEHRSSVTTYYRPAPRVREYREETESEYRWRRSSYRGNDNEY